MMVKVPEGPLGFDVTLQTPEERINKCISDYANDDDYKGFEKSLMQNLRLVSVKRTDLLKDGMEAFAVFELTMEDESLLNPMGVIHGGASATLVDMATSMAVAPVAKPGFWELSGVTRTLNITYLNPPTKGGTLVVECIVRTCGKKSVTTQAVVKDKKTMKPLLIGEHAKAALTPQGGTSSKI